MMDFEEAIIEKSANLKLSLDMAKAHVAMKTKREYSDYL
jgi:hypothetical protein